MVGSPCEVMHFVTDAMTGLAGSVMSQMVKPAKLAW